MADTKIFPADGSGGEVPPDKEKCTARNFCASPSDCHRRCKADIEKQPGPGFKCFERWQIFNKILALISSSLLGVTFFVNFVIVRTTRFSLGQPFPMHLPGGCICEGGKFCDDVLFTFDMNPKNESYVNNYTGVWKYTQWWDLDAPRTFNEYHKIAASPWTDLIDDELPVANFQDIKKDFDESKFKAGAYAQFKVTTPAPPVFDDVPGKDAHWKCEKIGNKGEYEQGSPWVPENGIEADEFCTRTKTFTVLTMRDGTVTFHDTLAELTVNETSVIFKSPICGQGPSMFATAGLRDNVAYLGIVDKIPEDEKNRKDVIFDTTTVTSDAGDDSDSNSEGSSNNGDGRRLFGLSNNNNNNNNNNNQNSNTATQYFEVSDQKSCEAAGYETIGSKSDCEKAAKSFNHHEDDTATDDYKGSCSSWNVACKAVKLILDAIFGGSGMPKIPSDEIPTGCSTADSSSDKALIYNSQNPSNTFCGDKTDGGKTHTCLCKKDGNANTNPEACVVPEDVKKDTWTKEADLLTKKCKDIEDYDTKYPLQEVAPVNSAKCPARGTCFVDSAEWGSNYKASYDDDDNSNNAPAPSKQQNSNTNSGGSENSNFNFGSFGGRRRLRDRRLFGGNPFTNNNNNNNNNQNSNNAPSPSNQQNSNTNSDDTDASGSNSAKKNGTSADAAGNDIDYSLCCEGGHDLLPADTDPPPTLSCRPHHAKYTVLQAPWKDREIKSFDHDSCWLADHVETESRGKYKEDIDWQYSWRHKQMFQQPNELDSNSLLFIGLLLAILCGFISFMEFVSAFLPEDHVVTQNGDVKDILRKLTCCKLSAMKVICIVCCKCKKWKLKKEGGTEKKDNKKDGGVDAVTKAAVAAWDPLAQDDENDPEDDKNCCEKTCRCCHGKKADDFLVYLLINLPFNFMVSCYTLVGPSLIKSKSKFPRKDYAGLWEMNSPMAVEMVDMPTTFAGATAAVWLLVAPGLTWFLRKKWPKDSDEPKPGRGGLCAQLGICLTFFVWLGIAIWIFSTKVNEIMETLNKGLDVNFRWGDIVFGVAIPFQVPSLQLPTAIFSFSFGSLKLLILAGEIGDQLAKKFQGVQEAVDNLKAGPFKAGEAPQADSSPSMLDDGEITGQEVLDEAKNKAKSMAEEKAKGFAKDKAKQAAVYVDQQAQKLMSGEQKDESAGEQADSGTI